MATLLTVITGELKSKVDRVWDAFWSGGISNPLEVIEQITYLLYIPTPLYIRRLDELQTLAEGKARVTGTIVNPKFTPDQRHLRWSEFRNDDPEVMFEVVGNEVFPFLRDLGDDKSTYSDRGRALHHPDAAVAQPGGRHARRDPDGGPGHQRRPVRVHALQDRLSRVNGQFRTPSHIIKLMVDLMAPAPDDEICDPACGTAGFLVAASEYVRDQHPTALTDARQRKHFHHSMFHGYDFDSTMLRIGSMNMMMHGIEAPDIRYRDSLSEGASGEVGRYTLILANPPFAGSLDYESTSKDLQRVVKTKKTELLFVALFLRLLKTGGRAAVIVPDGVLFGSSTAHRTLRKTLVEDQKLDAVVKLPPGVFRPYAGVSTAILFFTKTDSGGTDQVWFYDVRADGFSLDDKRNPIEANDLPDVAPGNAVETPERKKTERTGPRSTEQSFTVPKADIVRSGLRPVSQPLQGSGARRGRAPATHGDHRRHREARGGDCQG